MSEIIEARYREVMPERLNIIAAEIRSLKVSMCMQVIEIGRRLEEAKALCPRGKWGEWVKDMTGYSQSMAENYIKAFNEYGGGQINLGGDFVNSQSFANLGVTKLLALTAIPPEEREEFVKENDVENKSVSELKELLEIEKKKSEDVIKKRLEAEDRVNKLQLETNGLRSTMEMYQAQIAQLEEQMKNTFSEVSESELDEFRKEAEAAVREETEKSIKALREAAAKNEEKIRKLEDEKKKLGEKLKNEGDKVRAEEASKLKAAQDKANKASEAAEAALNEVERLKKELNMSDSVIVEFKTLFENAQDTLDKLMRALGRIENKETADKLSRAVGELVKRYSKEK